MRRSLSNLSFVFERMTDRARRVLVPAQEEARLLNCSFIGTEHILLGLIGEGEGHAARVLEALGVSLEVARSKVEETIGTRMCRKPPPSRRSGAPDCPVDIWQHSVVMCQHFRSNKASQEGRRGFPRVR
jgi:ATP-dependent Clp protease ATP-binding subunit ClpA